MNMQSTECSLAAALHVICLFYLKEGGFAHFLPLFGHHQLLVALLGFDPLPLLFHLHPDAVHLGRVHGVGFRLQRSAFRHLWIPRRGFGDADASALPVICGTGTQPLNGCGRSRVLDRSGGILVLLHVDDVDGRRSERFAQFGQFRKVGGFDELGRIVRIVQIRRFRRIRCCTGCWPWNSAVPAPPRPGCPRTCNPSNSPENQTKSQSNFNFSASNSNTADGQLGNCGTFCPVHTVASHKDIV